ncbi:MAG: hypothetical protein AUH33_03700 [Chloroflexi bacterium 13_1_40CM_68_21]|nr:MAG: hypothetical protein AUH33_03700 [Chloroflexi bacterium 13_1_40CM_68_21]
MTMPNEVITALAGLVASFLSGLLGIGGGLVLTPLLLYLPPLVGGTPIPVKIVTGLTLAQAISGSLLGVIRHRSYGNVSAQLVWLMGPPIAIASLIGAFVSQGTSDRILLLIFAALAIAGAVMLLLPVKPRDADAGTIAVRRPVAIAIALVLGFFGGMVGIGGIAFIIAALVYILRVPTRLAIGTSLGIGLFAATAALVGKAATAQIDAPLAAVVFVSALVASPVGAAVSVRTQPRMLLGILSVVVILAAIRITITALTGA